MPLLSVRDGSRTVLDTLTAVLFRIGRIAAAEDDDVFLAHQRPAALDVRYESRTAAPWPVPNPSTPPLRSAQRRAGRRVEAFASPTAASALNAALMR
jgi:hypothetical protein